MNVLNFLSILAADVCTPGTGTGYHPVPTFAFSLGKILLRLVLIAVVACISTFVAGRIMRKPRLADDAKTWGVRIVTVTAYAVAFWLGLSMVLGYSQPGSVRIIDIVCGGVVIVGSLIAAWSRASEGSNSILIAVYVLLFLMMLYAFIAPSVVPELPAEYIPRFFYDARYPSSLFCG